MRDWSRWRTVKRHDVYDAGVADGLSDHYRKRRFDGEQKIRKLARQGLVALDLDHPIDRVYDETDLQSLKLVASLFLARQGRELLVHLGTYKGDLQDRYMFNYKRCFNVEKKYVTKLRWPPGFETGRMD